VVLPYLADDAAASSARRPVRVATRFASSPLSVGATAYTGRFLLVRPRGDPIAIVRGIATAHVDAAFAARCLAASTPTVVVRIGRARPGSRRRARGRRKRARLRAFADASASTRERASRRARERRARRSSAASASDLAGRLGRAKRASAKCSTRSASSRWRIVVMLLWKKLGAARGSRDRRRAA